MKNIFFLLLFIGTSIVTYSQNTINNYKYVLIPKKFDFVKEENKYQLNELTKFLFEREGFVVVYGDEIPEEYAKNNCLGLKADVKSKAKFLSVKMIIELKDCKNNLIFTSDIGKSKEKDFKKGYQEGIRNAFKSIEALNYKYEPGVNNKTINIVETSTVIKEEIKKEASQEIKPLAKNKITPEEEKKIAEVKETITKKVVQPVKEVETEASENLLYAQPIKNGYQLVDSAPKIVYILQATSLQDVFLLKNRKGIFLKKGNYWVLEFYDENGQLVQEKVNAKF